MSVPSGRRAAPDACGSPSGLRRPSSDSHPGCRHAAPTTTAPRRERPDHTLQSAALVHEAYVRLAGKTSPKWQNRTHFFGVAARLMREILVEYARSRGAQKRGGGVPPLALNEALAMPHQRNVDLILLDEALRRLAELDERQCRIVELRFFAGLSIEDTSEALGISAATVSREWTTARLWLRREVARTSAT